MDTSCVRIINFFAGYLYHQVKNYRFKIATIESALILLLKESMLSLYQVLKEKDTISIEEKEKTNKLFHEYEKFECCSIIQDIMTRLEQKRIE